MSGAALKTFLELETDDCRFPVGEAPLPGERTGSATLFCGAPIFDRGATLRPYCEDTQRSPRGGRDAHAAFARVALAIAARDVRQITLT